MQHRDSTGAALRSDSLLASAGIDALAKTKRAWVDAAPLGHVACVHAQASGWFGFGRKDIGLVISLEGDGGVLGEVVVGRTDDDKWARA